MLRRVTIDNYALIDSLEIDFSEGLNIITGETGAGKSLLLGALSIALGGKADGSVARDVSRPCVIEAEFDIAGLGLESIFDESDIDYADTSVIRRVINPTGKSRAFVNDLPVGAATLKDIGNLLIDIHSQHQTLLLGSNKFQTELLDGVAKNAALIAKYQEEFDLLKSTVRNLAELRAEQAEKRKDQDYIAFQYAQLDQARLEADEQQQLEQLLNELIHAAEIKETMLSCESILSSDESGTIIGLKAIENNLHKTSAVFPKCAEMAERIASISVDLKDISSELAREGERIEVDPPKVEKTQQRLDTIYSLQQKHKVSSTEELIELKQDFAEQLSSIENYDLRISELEKTAENLKKSAWELARKIGAGRRSAAPVVEKQVVAVTSMLGMPNVRFVVDIAPLDELNSGGADRVKFLFSANKNVAPQPVEQIASGGEMSRLMLSLKSLMAEYHRLPTIIFDEIDSGISGEIADKMGAIIHSLSTHLQIINITHLPQVASKGSNHFFVYKEDSKNATNTRIRRLSPEERVTEIAKMLSGSQVTQAAIEQARTLITEQ